MPQKSEFNLISAAKVGDVTAAVAQLDAGANPDFADESGHRPLHWAAQEGFRGIVAVLLSRGAHVDARGDGGFTPLYIATGEGHLEVAKLLLEHKANPNLSCPADGNGTPLHSASAWNRVPIVELLLRHRADPEALDDDRRTAIFYAVMYGHVDVLRVLLDYGADVQRSDAHDMTPIDLALASSNTAIGEMFERHRK